MNRSVDAVPGGVVFLSNDLRILAVNGALGDLVGRTSEDLIGCSLDILLSAPSRILFQTHVYPALTADGHVEEVFLTLESTDGAQVPVLLNVVRAPHDDDERDGVAFHGLVVRVRARSEWEAELLRTTRALEQEQRSSRRLAAELSAAMEDLTARYAEQQRDREFRDALLGIVGHEVRTPITTIYGMAHVLRRGHRSMDAATIESHLDDIEAEADRLRRLTEDLLVLSRAEGGRLVIANEPVLIEPIVRSAVASEQARSTGHTFAITIEDELPIVLAEETYLVQVLRNLLNNAAKYSPRGTTIRVTVSAEDDGVAVRVIDAGPGVPVESPERLFELFYRAPEAARQTSGAGIGLFICRELIAAMGGRVWAAPAAPPATAGAEFGFLLPSIAGED